ncbi:hypothetical protein HYW74_02440 [Candidatus Pacearchaeota archaeon]|nr:hypothetical protein [Candidatus Pacearchaeota archaeon]
MSRKVIYLDDLRSRFQELRQDIQAYLLESYLDPKSLESEERKEKDFRERIKFFHVHQNRLTDICKNDQKSYSQSVNYIAEVLGV